MFGGTGLAGDTARERDSYDLSWERNVSVLTDSQESYKHSNDQQLVHGVTWDLWTQDHWILLQGNVFINLSTRGQHSPGFPSGRQLPNNLFLSSYDRGRF